MKSILLMTIFLELSVIIYAAFLHSASGNILYFTVGICLFSIDFLTDERI